eukprot:6200691-Pleurochrysis_carterae.AAC.2
MGLAYVDVMRILVDRHTSELRAAVGPVVLRVSGKHGIGVHVEEVAIAPKGGETLSEADRHVALRRSAAHGHEEAVLALSRLGLQSELRSQAWTAECIRPGAEAEIDCLCALAVPLDVREIERRRPSEQLRVLHPSKSGGRRGSTVEDEEDGRGREAVGEHLEDRILRLAAAAENDDELEKIRCDDGSVGDKPGEVVQR